VRIGIGENWSLPRHACSLGSEGIEECNKWQEEEDGEGDITKERGIVVEDEWSFSLQALH